MNDRLGVIEERLAGVFAEVVPPRLAEACRYPLHSGGKRIRPLLCVAAAEAVGGEWRAAIDAAAALELIHTYSLVHDDLPCMDDDAERRGRPTVHVVYGDALALLVGDALLTEAFAVLADLPDPLAARLARELSRAGGARGMILGQARDIGVGGPITGIDALVALHRAKTGALLRAAVRMGGICGGADAGGLAALDAYGDAIGLAFQVQDDVLDAEQDAGDDGPPSYVKLLGLEGARRAAELHAELAIGAIGALSHPGPLRALGRLIVERDR